MALVGINELREMLGFVSRQRADQLSRRPDFPEPKVRHPRYRLWDDAEVEAWIAEHRPSEDEVPPEQGDEG